MTATNNTNNTLTLNNNTLNTLRQRGAAARRLLDGANGARRARAARVKVAWAVARNGGGVLVARVLGKEEYAVRVDLDRATFNCTCPDHGRVGPCKHVLAVAERWVVNHARPEWIRLTAVCPDLGNEVCAA